MQRSGRFKGPPSYFVVLFDVIRSQKIENRQLVTNRLKKGIRMINELFKHDMYAPFEITRGDEVAAVLTSIERIFQLFREFCDVVSPVKLRMAVSYGMLTAGLSGRRSTEIDGPAFYAVDDAMKRLKKSQRSINLRTNDPL